ncbi:MAG TPA: sialidase family protein, partial [Ktedonobacterales bacterium]|nr:sialidase family protein [Ktedonobacterales bacterium]
HRLEHDGAASRETIAHINQRLQQRITQLSGTQVATNQEPERIATVSAPTPAPRAIEITHRAPRNTTMRRWVTVMATVAVVIAFVAILSQNAGRRSGGVSSQQMPAGATAPTNTPPTDWIDLTQLDYSTSFSANDLPAMAPSNSQVVYETMAKGMQQRLPATLRATSDGGATWRTLAMPIPTDNIGYAGIGVSPLDPQTVFLSLIDTTVAHCPANSIVNPGEGYLRYCWLQYSSFDGGAHWSATNLPLAGGSKQGLLSASMTDGFGGSMQSNTLRAQGQRLFAGFLCAIGSCGRLVTSDDGGRTWSFADLPLLAHGAANVCDYAANASGADLYAVTSPTTCDFMKQTALTLWRSVDAGTTWVKVRQLASPNERGMALTQSHATGATLLYMAAPTTTSQATDKMGGKFPVFSQAPSDVKVSTDGGATWQSAPTQGIPHGHAAYLQMGLLGTLSDGSVVIDVIPPGTTNLNDSFSSSNFEGSDLYAWKPGDSGWRLVGSVSKEIDGLLVNHAQTGDYDTIYAFLTTRNDENTFSILKKVVVP